MPDWVIDNQDKLNEIYTQTKAQLPGKTYEEVITFNVGKEGKLYEDSLTYKQIKP